MNWFKRLTGGLNKTASGIKKSIGSIFKGNKLDVSKLESLEDQLIACDIGCLLYTSPSPRDVEESRMQSSA